MTVLLYFLSTSYLVVKEQLTGNFVLQASCTKLKAFCLLKLSLKSDLNFGGGDRDRTCDIQLAKLALSQLSYTPAGLDLPVIK